MFLWVFLIACPSKRRKSLRHSLCLGFLVWRGVTLLVCIPVVVLLNLQSFAITLGCVIKITGNFCVEKLQKAEKVVP